MDEMTVLTETQKKAMDALFQFSAAVDEGDLSVRDLADVIKAALQTGHDVLEIQLSMACNAVRLAKGS